MEKTSVKSKINNITDCVLSENGVFKYIQIKLSNKEENKIVVRGWDDLEYHKENYDRFKEKEDLFGFTTKAIGGGRVDINKEKKIINVYGYSQSYGRCDHSLTCEIIKTQFPDYKTSWSNEGY